MKETFSVFISFRKKKQSMPVKVRYFLISETRLNERQNYDSHFTAKETEAQRIHKLAERLSKWLGQGWNPG